MLRLNFNLEYMEIQSRRILKMVTNHFINQVQWLFFRNLFLLISEFQELNVYQPKRKLNLLHSTYPNFTRMINNSICTISFKSVWTKIGIYSVYKFANFLLTRNPYKCVILCTFIKHAISLPLSTSFKV